MRYVITAISPMRRAVRIHFMWLGLVLLGGAGNRAVAQDCAPPSAAAARHLVSIRTSLADSVDLAATGLELVASSEVALVQIDSVCTAGRTAFNGVVVPSWGREPAGQVWVFSAGPNRYVVVDGLEGSRHYTAYLVFDQNWQYVGGFMG
jgi:hypothetical protein